MRITRWLVSIAFLTFAACGGGGGNNDGDDDVPAPPCSDGEDNDGDGTVDFPEDLGCISPSDDTEDSPAMPQCSDGRDNDGDGKADFPNDPGCSIAQQDDEIDDCPDGPSCPQCGNNRDDDGNGSMDYPNDPGCASASDVNEFIDNPVACGPNMMIKQLPGELTDSGMLDGTSTSMIMSPCGGGGGSPAIAYVVLLTEPKVVRVSTIDAGTTADTVIDIRGAECQNPDSHLACNDDADASTTQSTITRSLPTGTYYIIISGHDSSSTGAYSMKVEMFSGEGATCTANEQCGPGLVCRPPNGGGTGMTCQQPMCNDDFDNDGDGKIDHPEEPGCSSPSDNDETDTCPGAGCPECSDGLDNDGDGKIDFGAGANNDPSCKAAGDTSEACVTSEAVETITTAQTMGSTIGASNDFNPTCASSGGSGPDKLYRLDLPAVSVININLSNLSSGYDSVHTLLGASCGGTAIKCSDSTQMANTNLAAGTYYLVVDGFFADDAGDFRINIDGKVAPGGSCEGELFAAGALTCDTGFTCDGPAGAKTCRTQCSDGLDNNGDGKTDFPEDPGCASAADNDENTVCPGAMCPACADGTDNDGDGDTDFPADTSCVAAGGTNESCVSAEAITVVTQPATMGTTVGATNDFNPTCASTSGSGPDVHLQLDLPAMATLNLNLTTSYDSVHALLPASCTGAALSCQDPTTMALSSVAAGRYFLVVDGFFSTSAGTFTLNVSGTVAPGGSCEGALFTSGALTCSAGLVCQGPAGAKTCSSQCSDGVDNNGDGKTDFPDDPGCASPSDNTETTVCPGASCPVCADTMDNDGDMATDFPSDFGCTAAGGTSEAFCAVDPDFAGAITMPSTMGNNTATADNYDQTCQANTQNDTVYSLQLPVPVASLQIDTLGSTVADTVVSLKDANCGVELGCDDDSDPNGFLSLLVVSNVPKGNYAIQVDSFSTTNNGPFKLNVKGTVKPGTACTASLFSTGVLVCPTGTSCTGGICQ